MKIIAKIPATKTFDLPGGRFPATLTQIKPQTKQARKGPQPWVRLLFEVQIPGLLNQIPCAGRNFLLDLNPGSDLRNFLENWLGRSFFQDRSNQEFDFETLIGRTGSICLSHFTSDEYDRPLVIVESIFPLLPSQSIEKCPALPLPIIPTTKSKALIV